MAVIWTIAQLERNTDGNGVVVAHWRASDSEVVGEVTHSGGSYGTCGFTPDATADGYVAYDSLTEAEVIAWVKADLDTDAIEESIAALIAVSKEPVTAAGVPW
jgi:hypothetical protein